MSRHYKFIVIGGGSSGYAGASTFREHSESVAIVDGAPVLGGLCILRGCMPSKTLIYVAEILYHARHGKTFGLDIPQATPDMAAIQARKRRIIDGFSDYRTQQLESARFHLYQNTARFVDERTIRLDDATELTADGFLVSTGSAINYPPVPGLEAVFAMTSDQVLDLNNLPDSAIVLGGGTVACELAQFLQRMGTRVVQVQRSATILKEGSPESARVVMQAFRDEGIELFTATTITGISKDGVTYTVRFTHDGSEIVREGAFLFNALGRVPNTRNLDLEKAGVDLLESGHIRTNGVQQTANPRIYAGGDCAGPHEIVHLAVLQGEVAARHALGLDTDPINYDHMTKIVFTDPQVASVGPGIADLQGRGVDLLSAEYPFDDHGKSILMEATYGYVRVWADARTGVVRGAECVGKDAAELIHAMAVGVALDARVPDLLKTHWYHPTLSEIWTYPLEEISESL